MITVSSVVCSIVIIAACTTFNKHLTDHRSVENDDLVTEFQCTQEPQEQKDVLHEDILSYMAELGVVKSQDTRLEGYIQHMENLDVDARDYIYQQRDGRYYYIQVQKFTPDPYIDYEGHLHETDETFFTVLIQSFTYDPQTDWTKFEFDPCNLGYGPKRFYYIAAAGGDIELKDRWHFSENEDNSIQ